MRTVVVFIVLYSVELGKQLATVIQQELRSPDPVSNHDASTNALINYMKSKRKWMIFFLIRNFVGQEHSWLFICKITLLWRRSISFRNQSIGLHSKSVDWFLYDRDLCQERVNWMKCIFLSLNSTIFFVFPFSNFLLLLYMYCLNSRWDLTQHNFITFQNFCFQCKKKYLKTSRLINLIIFGNLGLWISLIEKNIKNDNR